MQQNFTTVSVFILFAALQGGVIYDPDGDTTAIEILSLAFTVVCPICSQSGLPCTMMIPLAAISPLPAPFAVLQLISTHQNEIKTGLHQQ